MKELQGYERSGTHLFIDGHPGRAQEIAAACIIGEDVDYMRDFISEDGNRISEIHFIKIQNEKN